MYFTPQITVEIEFFLIFIFSPLFSFSLQVSAPNGFEVPENRKSKLKSLKSWWSTILLNKNGWKVIG